MTTTVSDCCNKEALFSAEEDIAIITIVTVGHSLELRQLKPIKRTHFLLQCACITLYMSLLDLKSHWLLYIQAYKISARGREIS